MLHQHLIAATSPLAHPQNIILFGNKRITILTPCLFRVEESNDGNYCDDATQVVWFRNMPPVTFQAEPMDNALKIRTEDVTFICGDTLKNSYIIFNNNKQVPVSNDENLLGTYRTLDRCDGDVFIPTNKPQECDSPIHLEQGVISKNGVAIYDDSASLLLTQDGTLKPRKVNGTDFYIFAYGTNYRAAVQALYQISGSTPAIPRFALGNWWSRYYAYTEKEYLQKMDSFADAEIPFTVATVDMDWHWSANMPGGVSGWTGYSWNTDLFPDYRRFLKSLHERNLYVTLNLHPADGVRPFEDMYEEMAKHMGCDPTSNQTIPFDLANENFVNAYFDVLHKPYEKDGVDFWWIDWQQGQTSTVEGLDPLWALNHYHSLDIAKNNEALILSRYAGIGSHRYPLGFSGDTFVTWNTLKYLPYFTATASNCGYTWWSHDIGGHMSGEKDNELYVRFIQFGVFSPINRLHSAKTPIFSKEPVSYKNGSGLIAKEFLKLRHSMIPFLYSASCETSEQGLALIEPMYYEYPEEPDAYECPGQYYFGRQLIAAPITEKSDSYGMVTKKVWLPEGNWTDVFTGDTYIGGKWQSMTRYLDSFPLLAKEGGFFVLDGAPSENSIALPKRLKVLAFQGNGCYHLYEDANNARAITHFVSEKLASHTQRITITIEDTANILPDRELYLELCNITEGQVTVSSNGTPLPFEVRHSSHTTVILRTLEANTVYEFTITETADEHSKKQAALCRVFMELEWSNNEKSNLYTKLCQAETKSTCHQLVEQSDLPEVFKRRLYEVID
ncbi:MAG: alpha-xylosidase [Lachnospiraceae bacterium]|nr:alpha-xylosidase [Lachnospiraceae bacterium]